MTEQPPPNIGGLLHDLVQQQTAIFQQQTALLQVHAESVRLQRLLVERLLGGEDSSNLAEFASRPEAAAWMSAPAVSTTSPLAESVTSTTVTDTQKPAPPARLESATAAPVSTPTPPPAEEPPPAEAESGSRAARYYQPRSAPSSAHAQPHDLELMRRLREIGDASSLILQFGPHKGATLAQVVVSDPTYVRQLVTRAQRPEVRAAATQFVEALEAAVAHTPRKTRGLSRRTRSKRRTSDGRPPALPTLSGVRR